VARVRVLAGTSTGKLVRGSGFIFACRLTGAVLALVTQIALARWMGADALGRYLIALSWCILLARLSGLGYNSAAVRFIGEALAHRKPGAIRGYIRFTRRTVALVAVGTGVVGAVGMVLLGLESWAFLFAFVALPLMAGIGIYSGIALSLSWFRISFLPNNVLRPVLFLLIVSGAWLFGSGVSAAGAMAAQAAAMLGTVLALALVMRRPLRDRLEDAEPQFHARRWTRTAVPLLVISLFTVYLPELSVIVSGAFLPASQVAILTVAYRVALMIAFGLHAVDSFIMPKASRMHASLESSELQHLVTRATLVRFSAAAFAVVAFAAFGRFALGLFGPEFVDGYPLLMILSCAQLVRAAAGPAESLLNVSGHQDECLKVYGVALVAVMGLIAIVAPVWGIVGVGCTILAVITASAAVLNVRVRRYLGIRPSLLGALRS
jgi:O-antigen/teichoic acid export membrane protein